MSALRESMAEYLAVRRALGHQLDRTEKLLRQFLDHLDATGADQITVERAVAWATLPGGGEHWHAMRLGVVRGFARYLHEVDPRVEVPPTDVLPDRSRRAVPYLYTDEQIHGADDSNEHATHRAQDGDVPDAVRPAARDRHADRGGDRA